MQRALLTQQLENARADHTLKTIAIENARIELKLKLLELEKKKLELERLRPEKNFNINDYMFDEISAKYVNCEGSALCSIQTSGNINGSKA